MKYDAKPVRILYDDEKLRDRILVVIGGRDATLGIQLRKFNAKQ